MERSIDKTMTQNEPTEEKKSSDKQLLTTKLMIGTGVVLLVCGGILVNFTSTKEADPVKKVPLTEYKGTPNEEEDDAHFSLPEGKQTKNKKKTSSKKTSSIFDLFDLPEQLSPVKKGTPRANLLLALAEESNDEYKKNQDQKDKDRPTLPVIPPTGPLLPPIIDPPVDPPIVVPPMLESTPVIASHTGEQVIEKYLYFNVSTYYSVTDSLDDSPIITISGEINPHISGQQSVTINVVNKFGNHASRTLDFYVNAVPQLIVSHDRSIEIQIDDMAFDSYSVIRASDEEDGDISGAIEIVSNTVDRHTEGPGEIEFKVTDSKVFSTYKTVSFTVTNHAPVIVFDKEDTHEINQPFDPLKGLTITDREDGNMMATEDMILENTVDVTTEGAYMVSYLAKDSHGKSSGVQKRVVKVVNEAPVIHGATDKEFHVNESISKEQLLDGVTATDREDDKLELPLVVSVDDGQFNAIDTNVEGSYPLTYIVTDSLGKDSKVTVTIVIKNDAPVIEGVKDTVELEVGDLFDPLEGVSVSDTETANDKLVIHVDGLTEAGTFDSSVSGTYTLTYSTEDEQGKKVEVTSVVTVKEPTTDFLAPLLFITTSSPMGERVNPLKEGEIEFHRGRDYTASAGSSILAIAGGTVIVSEADASWGEFVVIQHDNGYTSLYAHQSERKVNVGQAVKQGETIGLVGSTGDSTGSHLHVEVSTTGNWQTQDMSELVDISTLLN